MKICSFIFTHSIVSTKSTTTTKRPMELRANTSHSISLQCISIEQTPVQSTPSLASLDISGSVPYSTVCLRFERTFVIKCIARASWRSASTRLPPSNESIIFNFDFLFSFLYFLSLSHAIYPFVGIHVHFSVVSLLTQMKIERKKRVHLHHNFVVRNMMDAGMH